MNQNIALDGNVDYSVAGVNKDFVKDDTAAITVGKMLSQARKSMAESNLDIISEELCIRPHLLKALEQGDYNKFPSACYATGFLKNYAAHLGLNVTQIISQYKIEFQGSMKKVNLVFIETDHRPHYMQHTVVSLAILSMLGLFGVWYSMNNKDSFQLSALPNVTDVTSTILNRVADAQVVEGQPQNSPVIVNTPVEVAAVSASEPLIQKSSSEENSFQMVQQAFAAKLDAKAKTTAVVADQLRLSVQEDTWIRVIGENKETVVDRVFLAGEEFYLAKRDGMTLMTSNAGAISLYMGNTAMPSLGKSGEIRQNINLDNVSLPMTSAELSL